MNLLWIVWMASWLLAAGWSARTVAQQSLRERFVQSVPIWIGALLIFRRAGGPWDSRLFPLRPWMGDLAVGFALLGLGLTWWARIHLGRFWSGAVTLKAEHALIRSGPYSLTRHPIYTGLLLALLATACAHGSAAALAGFGFVLMGLTMKLRQEERFMESRFGSAYAAYKADVPALIPSPARLLKGAPR